MILSTLATESSINSTIDYAEQSRMTNLLLVILFLINSVVVITFVVVFIDAFVKVLMPERRTSVNMPLGHDDRLRW